MSLLHESLITASIWHFNIMRGPIIHTRKSTLPDRSSSLAILATTTILRLSLLLSWSARSGKIRSRRVQSGLLLELIELFSELGVQEETRGCLLVGSEDLLAKNVDELVEAEIHLGLDLIVQMPLLEHAQSIHRCVVVEIEWIEDEFHERLVFGLEDVRGEYPRHGHLDWKLDLFAHCHF